MFHSYKFHFKAFFVFATILSCSIPQQLFAQDDPPNILLIIADDMGVDVLNGYHQPNLLPSTPTLDSLRSVGITFDNVFASPKCTPTRANILSGKYGVKTGITGTPGNLSLDHTSIFKALEIETNNEYADAVFGKWHVSSMPISATHPLDHSADTYMGYLDASPVDYFAWPRTENGVTATDSSYVTQELTNASIEWINEQTQPWFLWVAHGAPHAPIHLPPSEMYTLNATGTNYRKYLTMIESLDYDINRLLNGIPEAIRENTIIIFIGDNGTPSNLTNDYPDGHGKSTVYQGGIRVPMIIAGAGVTRQGEREAALVHVTDIHATILEIAGVDLPGGVFNSLSFDHLLIGESGATRDYNYAELSDQGISSWTIRGPQYKLIQFVDSTQEMYDLLVDSLEFDNLLDGTLTTEQINIKADLEAEALQIRTSWSCRDHIKNGDEMDIDCGGSHCAPCILSAPEIGEKNNIRLSPNPTRNNLFIESQQLNIRAVHVFNSMGQLLLTRDQINHTEVNLNLSHLESQILFLNVQFESHTQILRFLKL